VRAVRIGYVGEGRRAYVIENCEDFDLRVEGLR